MIQIKNLSFAYQPHDLPILKNIHLCVNKGEWITLVGPNGCGKTTLLRHFNALLIPDEGEIWVDNLNTRDRKNWPEIRRRAGMIFQNPDNQIVGMTLEEDVAFGPGNLGLPADEIRRRVDNSLAQVGLAGLQKRSPHTLSGGQKQLLALAGLLAMQPQYILLDEPTSSLDPEASQQVLSSLQELKERGLGIIQITHHMEEAARADRMLVMDQGRIVEDGKPADVLCQVDKIKALGLAPPRITELMWLLHNNGEIVRTDILDVESAFQEITSLLSKLRSYSRPNLQGKVEEFV